MKTSVSIDNFLKLVYSLSTNPGGNTRPGNIARILGVSNAAATDMARKLAHKKLVVYSRYKKLSLTSEGSRHALEVIRKHRLWETFLYKVFELDLHEIHREAEMLEHQTSDFLAEKIYKYLGNPPIDPHGDPIPDINGKVTHQTSITLSQAAPGLQYTIIRILSSEKDVFDFCHSNSLEIGSSIRVLKQYAGTGMSEIQIEKSVVLMNKELSNIIFLQKQK